MAREQDSDDDYRSGESSNDNDGTSQQDKSVQNQSASSPIPVPSDSEDSDPSRSSKRVKITLKANAKDASSPKTCANELCGESIGRSRKGPNGVPLCYPCGAAYHEALKAAGGDELADDGWKQRSTRVVKKNAQQTSAPGPAKRKRKPKVEGEICDNCNKPFDSQRIQGPDNETLCNNCGQRYNIEVKRAKLEKRAETDLWRSGNAQRKKHDHTCKDCGSHESIDSDWTDNRCYYCRRWRDAYAGRPMDCPPREHNRTIPNAPLHTHAELSDLAWQYHRRFNPEHDPFTEHISPSMAPDLYWDQNLWELRLLANLRGIPGKAPLPRTVEQLQIADARNGLLPRPRPAGATRYHGMHIKDLENLAAARGFFSMKDPGPKLAEAYIKFLANQDIGADDAIVLLPMDPADAQKMAEILVNDLVQSLDFQSIAKKLDPKAARESAQTAASGVNRTSHNRGIFGRNDDLESLQTTLMREHFPSETSSRGYLCGPRAAAASFLATYRALRDGDPTLPALPDNFTAEEVMHRMMEMLFSDYRRNATMVPEQRGTPTPAYAQLIMSRIGHLYQTDRQLYSQESDNYRFLNNLDIEQVSAIFELIAQGEMLAGFSVDLGVGVVRGAHVRIAHPTAGVPQLENVPAHARRVRTGTQGDVWLYNNVAHGRDQYNHFEGFTSAGRGEMAFEWGLRTTTSEDAPKARFSKKDPMKQASETERLRGELRNIRRQLATRENKLSKVCDRCRELDNLDCNWSGGYLKTCDRCRADKSRCAGSTLEHVPLPTIKASAEIEGASLAPWDAELLSDEELMEATKMIAPTEEPEGPHYLLIGSARVSSNAGVLEMRTVLNSLVQTCTRYNDMIRSGVHNNVSEGQIPGGQAARLPSRRFHMAIARRGVLPVPWALGNIHDPYLHAWVNLWDELMRPGNPNLPQEIIILTLGIAGHTVPLTGYGDRQTGWLASIIQRDAQNGTNVAHSIHILYVVEKFVIDGSHISIAPGQALQGWLRFRNKYLRKFKLLDLVDRWALRQRVAQHQQLVTSGALPAGTPAPILPNGPHEVAMDHVINGTFDEAAFRQGGLDLNSTPSSTAVHSRNSNRNNPINPQ